MKWAYILLGLIILIFLIPNVSAGKTLTTIELNVGDVEIWEDTYINQVAPDGTAGASTDLNVGNGASDELFVTVIKFNMSALMDEIPSVDDIELAFLTFKISGTNNYADNVDCIEYENETWHETILTWNKLESEDVGSVIDTRSTAGKANAYVTWNVTTYIKTKYSAAANNVSFIMNGTVYKTGEKLDAFQSKESATPPELNVSYWTYAGTSQQDFKCNATTEGGKICGGSDGRYLYECKKFTDDSYQWDHENITYCEYGCFWSPTLTNYTCVIQEDYCIDRCLTGTKMCSNDGFWSFNCTKVASGCYGWSDTGGNKTYCQYGCTKGECINVTGECSIGDALCLGDIVYYCGDYNGDGLYEYSKYNSTFCQYGCTEVWLEDEHKINASCNWHSFDEIHSIRNQLTGTADYISYVAYSPNIKITLWIILSLIVTAFMAFITKGWESHSHELIMFSFLITIIFGTWISWIPWAAGIIILIIGGMIYVYGRE